MNRTPLIVMTLVIVAALAIVSALSYNNNKQLQSVAGDVKLLAQKIDKIQKTSDGLITKLNTLPSSGAPSVNEEVASDAYTDISDLVAAGELESAKTKIAEFMKLYGASKMASRVIQLSKELSVVGMDAPTAWGIEKWYQGEKEVSLTGDHTTLLVFWETWCHYCMQEAPNVQARYEKYKDKGLQVLGVTKVNKGSTDEKVAQFIKEKNIGYAIAKEDESLTKYFNVKGIPAAAVVKNGKIVWRGHPASLTDKLLEGYLGIGKS